MKAPLCTKPRYKWNKKATKQILKCSQTCNMTTTSATSSQQLNRVACPGRHVSACLVIRVVALATKSDRLPQQQPVFVGTALVVLQRLAHYQQQYIGIFASLLQRNNLVLPCICNMHTHRLPLQRI